MINREFDHIVSLGGHCQTVHQVRRYFGIDEAYPLDWWVTPTVTLVELFETGFADIFREENMKIVHENTGPAIMCDRYGTMHYHDFDEAKLNGEYSSFLVRAKCAQNVKKFAHLVRRLLTLEGDVLFVRFAHGWAQLYPDTRMFDAELLQRFMAILRSALPRANVNLLLLNDYNSHAGLDGNPFPGVYTSIVNNGDENGWSGSDRGWSELFGYHRIRVRSRIQALTS